jgi:hypothetical protein
MPLAPVLTLTVPGLRLRKYQNPLCFRVSAPFSSSLTAEFRIKKGNYSALFRVAEVERSQEGCP